VNGFELSPEQHELRESVARLCADFGDDYWRAVDEARGYPEQFVDALTTAGWLAVLIPEEYGGGGGTLVDAAIVLQTIAESGGDPTCAHAQLYTMGTVLRHGTPEQKARILPRLADGSERLQAFGVTEPDAGSETTNISTFARRTDNGWVVNGSKVWTSRVQHSDYLLLLARTTPRSDGRRKTDGISVFLVDLRDIAPGQLTVTPIVNMINHETNALFFDNMAIPANALVGTEGEGFRYILSGMNAERILIASEAIGDGLFFVRRASKYATERIVFGRPIGANQGVQFPLAQAHADLSAASLLRWQAALLFDRGEQPGFEANAAKLLASQAAWRAANAAMDAFGGYGLASEYGIERKFRETRLTQVAPISNNLVLAYIAQSVLGLPRSY
jgi:acyl-CoA dehydrogenase